MSKKDDAPAISLFSFQDIITSLTGIMFLIVLLLIIFMLEMKPKTAEIEPDAVQTESVSEQQIADIERAILELELRQKKMQERISEIKKLDLEHIKIRIARFRNEVRKQLLAEEKVKTDILQKCDVIQKTEKEITELEKTEELLALKVKMQQAKIKEKEKFIETVRAQTVKAEKAVKYTVKNGSALEPVLVECSKDGVQVLLLKNGKEIDLRIKDGNARARKKKFLDWLKTRRIDAEYYTVLIKPESFEYSSLIMDIKNAHPDAQRGLEILPSDELSIFGGE